MPPPEPRHRGFTGRAAPPARWRRRRFPGWAHARTSPSAGRWCGAATAAVPAPVCATTPHERHAPGADEHLHRAGHADVQDAANRLPVPRPGPGRPATLLITPDNPQHPLRAAVGPAGPHPGVPGARLRRVRKRLSLSQNSLGEGRWALRAGYFECQLSFFRAPEPRREPKPVVREGGLRVVVAAERPRKGQRAL